MTDKEFRDHWERQGKTLSAIAKGMWVVGLALLAGGIWVGTIEANVADHARRITNVESEVKPLADHTRRIASLESEIKPVARLDERLISQQAQLNRIERLLERLTGSPARGLPYGAPTGTE